LAAIPVEIIDTIDAFVLIMGGFGKAPTLFPLAIATFLVTRQENKIDAISKATSESISKSIKETSESLAKEISVSKAATDASILLVSKDISVSILLVSKDIKANADAITRLEKLMEKKVTEKLT
jgi:hypothetical protein